MANDSDLNVKISADSSGLRDTLESAGKASEGFSNDFRAGIAHLNETLRDLDNTLVSVAENTQKTANATQHLSNVTDFVLVVTGVKLLGDVMISAASGVVALGSEVKNAAVAFDSWARSEAYVTGQTNAVRVENEKFGQSYKPIISSALQLGVAYGGIRYGVMASSAALAAGTVVARGAASALSLASTAVTELTIGFARNLTPAGIAMSVAYTAAAQGVLSLTALYGRASQAVHEWWQWTQVYNSAALEAAASTITLTGNLARFSSEMKGLGFDNTTRGLQYFMSELMKMPSMTESVAGQIESSIATLPDFTGALNESLIQTIRLTQNTAEGAKSMADALVATFRNPEANGEQFLRSLGNIKPKLIENFQEAQRTGEVYKMQAALVDGLVELTRRARDNASRRVEEEIKTYTSMGISRATAEKILSLTNSQIATSRAITEEADKQIEKLEQQKRNLLSMLPTMDEIRLKALDIAKSYGTPTATIEVLTGQVKTLRTAAAAATSDAAQMIKTFEGFERIAKWDVNHFRAGFGSDTYVDEAGKIREVVQGTVVTVEQANEDLARRVTKVQTTLESALGDSWNNVSARAKASMTSIVYNYGEGNKELLAQLKSAAAQGDAAVADVIRHRAGDNGGANAGRRMAEASNITSNVSESTQRQINEALAVAESRLKTANDLREGGNAVQKTELEIARAHAQGLTDEVDEHKRLAESLRAEASSETDLVKKAELQKRALTEQAQVRELEINRMRAQAQLEAGVYETGTQKRYDILMAELNKETELRAKEPDKLREVEARKQAVEDEFTKSRAREQQSTEDAKFQESINRLREEADVFRQQAAMKRITDDELKDSLLRNLAEREAAERQHWERLKEIWGEGTRQFDNAQKQLTALASKESLARTQVERSANMQTFQSYNSTFQAVGNSISSSLMGVITGQQKLRQAFGAVLQQMTQMVISEGIKRAAAWAAGQATELTATIGTETAKTGTVVAGGAARDAARTAEQAGKAAIVASDKALTLADLGSEIAKVFAGVSAFLAPVMGPYAPAAAGGIAAGVGATAAGMAAMDIGAYNLPRDMPAQLHMGELVMPAREADAFRSVLSAVAGGSSPEMSGGGHTVNVTLHASAIDGRGLTQALKGVGRDLAKIVSTELNNNPSIRPSY